MLYVWILDMSTTVHILDGAQTVVTNYNPLFVVIAGIYTVSAFCWFFINCTDSLDRPRLTEKQNVLVKFVARRAIRTN